MKSKLAILTLGIAALGVFTLSAQEGQTQWDGIFTQEQAQRGAQPYADKCAVCHGEGMLGDEMSPGLVGGVFSANWNELSIGDLFERIQITMPQDNPGSLSSQEIADIIAYILQGGEYPAGKTELPARPEDLRMYKFLAMKPGA